MTEAKVSGNKTGAADLDGDGTNEANLVTNTIIPHFALRGGPLQVLASYYLENVEGTTDNWVTDDSFASTLLVVDVKFTYDDAGSFVKGDILNRVVASELNGGDEFGKRQDKTNGVHSTRGPGYCD